MLSPRDSPFAASLIIHYQITASAPVGDCFLPPFIARRRVAISQEQRYYICMRYLRLGRYLCEKGLITERDILNARLIQKKSNLRIGELARARGWLNDDDIYRILIIQEDTHEKFGEIAVKHRYLSTEQVKELLKEQEDTHIFFGEALVRIGAISEGVLIEQLKEFNKLEFQNLRS